MTIINAGGKSPRIRKSIGATVLICALLAPLSTVAATPAGGPPVNPISVDGSGAVTFAANATGQVLDGLVHGVINDLQNAVTKVAGDVATQLNTTIANLSSSLNEFEGRLHNDLTVPLNSLSLDLQNEARTIAGVALSTDQMLTHQQMCALDNGSALASQLANASQQLKLLTLFHNAPSAVSYFQFDGHSINIVPEGGGHVVIYGTNLWDAPPKVDLYAPDNRSLLRALDVQRARDDNSLGTDIDAATIKQYAGKSLQLHVTPVRAKRWWFVYLGTEDGATLDLPISIPPTINTQYSVVGYAQYSCGQTATVTLQPAQSYFADNSSCENRQAAGQNLQWSAPVDDQGYVHSEAVIIDQGLHLDTRDTTWVTAVTNGLHITISGTLDTADCTNFMFGTKLNHSTYWHGTFTPKAQYPINVPTLRGPSSSAPQDWAIPDSYTNVNLPTACAGSTVNTYWYEVHKIVNGTDVGVVFASPRTTVSEHGGSDVNVQGMMTIYGQFNPVPVNGDSQLSVHIHAPECGV